MKYAETDSVEKGLRFKSPTGLVVETTGDTTHIASHEVYVHEVVIVEGTFEGNKYLLNLDNADPL